MDSETAAASRIAGQPRSVPGTLFTAIQQFKPEFGFWGNTPFGTRDASGVALPLHRRSADAGDGRHP
jgi:hypothetical protein